MLSKLDTKNLLSYSAEPKMYALNRKFTTAITLYEFYGYLVQCDCVYKELLTFFKYIMNFNYSRRAIPVLKYITLHK